MITKKKIEGNNERVSKRTDMVQEKNPKIKAATEIAVTIDKEMKERLSVGLQHPH